MIQLLPKWMIEQQNYAFDDVDSATVLEQTAKLCKKINELIDLYNNLEMDMNCFKLAVKQIMNDYMCAIDTKISIQNVKVNNAVDYMKTHLDATINTVVNEKIEDGTLTVGMVYDSTTEELDIVVTGGADSE